MVQIENFLKAALTEIEGALDEASSRANLHLKPDTISLAAARRIRALLSCVETMFRRILMLLAMSVELSPVRAGIPTPVKTLRNPFGGFTYLEDQNPRITTVEHAIELPFTGKRRPVSMARLLHRLRTFRKLLEAPDMAARHMARLLARRKSAGALRPVCFAQDGLFRLKAELALIAQSLQVEANTALRTYFSSG